MTHQAGIDLFLSTTASRLIWQKLGQEIIDHFHKAIQGQFRLLPSEMLQRFHAAILVIDNLDCQ